MKLRFFICEHCGNIIVKVEDKGVPVVCCGQKMTELIPDTVDAAREKHVPVYAVENGTVSVTVGSVAHPMTEPHHISWIVLQTDRGFQFRELDPLGAPAAGFALAEGETAEAVYAYCNLHGLWKA